MRTREQEKRRFLLMVGGFFVIGSAFVVAVGLVMITLRALGIVSPPPGATDGASSGPVTPLVDFALTFSESSTPTHAGLRVELGPGASLACKGRKTAATKVSGFELVPLGRILAAPDFRAAAKPGNTESGDVSTYELHVTSKASNLDATGVTEDAPAPIRAALVEIEKLCDLESAPSVAKFTVVYTRTEQGGTAGRRDVYEVRSDGTAELRDAERTLRTRKVTALDLAPLSRLLARPELAALGPSFTHSPKTPSIPEVDYDLEISKSIQLSGVFDETTPPIIDALAAETTRVVGTSPGP